MPQGIACIGLSIVDGAGNLVKLVSYPKPVPGDTAAGVSTEDMEDTIQTQVFSRAHGAHSVQDLGVGQTGLREAHRCHG